jgi:hypothetical protein
MTSAIEIISREDARAKGLVRFFTGEPCKRGHTAERLVSRGNCVECNRLAAAQWKANNPKRNKEIKSASYRKHAARNRQKAAEYREKHRDAVRKAARERYYKNPEKYIKANAEYCANRRGKRSFDHSMSRSKKRGNLASWADFEKILLFYERAHQMTKKTGVLHHVDHVIPVHGETVSGLHVETNLQILTIYENGRKGARFNPSEPDGNKQGDRDE